MENSIKIVLIIILIFLILVGAGAVFYFMNSDKAVLIFNRASESYKIGEVDDIKKGIEFYNTILIKYPDSDLVVDSMYKIGEGYELLSKKLKDLTKLDVAKEKYITFLSKYPNSALSLNAYIRIANINIARGNFDEALQSLDVALAKFPDTQSKASIYNLRGDIYFEMKNYEKAFECYINKDNMNDDWAIIGRARCYAKMNQIAKAIDIYEEFITYRKMSPYKTDAESIYLSLAYNYAKKLYDARRYEDAIGYFERIFAIMPDSTEGEASLYWIAESYYDLDRYEQAIKAFRKVLTNNNNGKDEDALFKLGKCFYEQRLFGEALKEFQRMLDGFPNGRKFKEATEWKQQTIRELKYQQ